MNKLNYAAAAITAASMLVYAAPALASVNSSSIQISNSSHGAIHSDTDASASTGHNWAGGSTAGNGGAGSSVTNSNDDGSYNNGGATGGAAGNGGNSSAGGLVVTGDATADSGAANSLNSNDVSVSVWGSLNSSALGVANSSGGYIHSDADARARTGGNDADGSKAGNGGSAGSVHNSNDDGSYNNAGASAGNGGHGGTSGIGGQIQSGFSTASAGSINVLNTNLVRVRI